MELDLGAQHVKAIYNALKKQDGLFTLPYATLDALSERLGDSFAKDLADEFERVLDADDSRYLEEGIWPILYQIGPDLKFLSGLSSGWERAFSLFVRCAEIDIGLDVDSQDHSYWDFNGAQWDSLAATITSNGIELSLPSQRSERASHMIRKLRKSQAEIVPRLWFGRRVHERCYARAKIYEKGLLYLYDTHSDEVGNMLSLKVAGHLLPPELVDLIAECWRDERTKQDCDVEMACGTDDEARDISDDNSESEEPESEEETE